MGRPLRKDEPGWWHHLVGHGARDHLVFIDDSDRELFLSIMEIAAGRYGVEVHSYCLLDNHYHLVARSRDGNLSRFMQYLLGCYVRRFNRRHGFSGSLFKDRFWSKVLLDDDQLNTVIRYVHNNAWDTGSDPHTYRWCSLSEHAPSWITRWHVHTMGSPV